MKQRFLPVAFISIIALSLTAYIWGFAAEDEDGQGQVTGTVTNAENTGGYLAELRNNQHTGVIDPEDVALAYAQVVNHPGYKPTKASGFDWVSLGPDNMGGRTRALLFDNRDGTGNTLYAGNVTGGLFKSTTGGTNWAKVNLGGENAPLPVTSMVQDDNGTIYVGTGEGFATESYTATGQFGYTGGFIGRGIFKSGSDDNFTILPSTAPSSNGDINGWSYINKLAVDNKNNRLFAATNSGLKVADLSDLNNWKTEFKYRIDSTIINRSVAVDSIIACDSFNIIDGNLVLYGSNAWVVSTVKDDTIGQQTISSKFVSFIEQGICYDVAISPDGWIITTFNNKIYVSYTGNTDDFILRSVYPNNPDNIRNDNINWTYRKIIKDKAGNVLYETTSSAEAETGWHTDYKFDALSSFKGYPHSSAGRRTGFAIAPSNSNIVYAIVAAANKSLQGIYLSEDGGNVWRIVAPGGSQNLNILGIKVGSNLIYQGDYTMSLAVYPTDPYQIVAGGYDLWHGQKVNESGFYSWVKKSISQAFTLPGGIFDELYCHKDHHIYLFRPNLNNQFIIGTDGGIFLGKIAGNSFTFQTFNKNYISSQFHSIGISGEPNEYVAGAQDNGTVYNRGKGGTGKSAQDIWRPINFSTQYSEGTDGATVAFSTIRSITVAGEEVPPPVFYSKTPFPLANQALNQRLRRSESLGFDYSLQFLTSTISDDRYLTPILLWESFNNQLSHSMVEWGADKSYSAGSAVVARSNTMDHPFDHFLEEDVNQGDTILIKDIITNKLFIGTNNRVFMTLESMNFAKEPEWFAISHNSHNGVTGKVQCMAYSADANYLWAGTMEGKLFRISNIAYATGFDDADATSPNCIIATTEVPIGNNNTQIVTSVSVDPNNPNNVLVTLGNYGNEHYVYYSTNGLSDFPVFNSIQGDLPTMPVYASLIEMNSETNQAILGTEWGVWATDNIPSGNWYYASQGIGRLPVLAIKQQTLYKGSFTLTFYDPGTNEALYEVYPAIKNYRDIYIATYGRGVFKIDNESVGFEEPKIYASKPGMEFVLAPNPASGSVMINLNLDQDATVHITIYDLSGRLIKSESFKHTQRGDNKFNVNLAGLNEGTYLVNVISGNKSASHKLLVIQ